MDDIIVGLSTALGVGAISIIRVSGSGSISMVNKIFKGENLENKSSHTITYGHIVYQNEIIDEVLVTIMKSPKTYTTEDIVEINCHGGISTTNKIIEILLECGCRLAEAGEFTKRAFINGRIDLIESESVNDLINAKSDASRKLALNNIGGNLTKKINIIREELIDIISNIEVNIDYPEYEDIEIITNKKILPKIEKIKEKINYLLKGAQNGKLIRNGINVALVGKPNVGKSSILNFLIDEEKAIVTDIAGTTRDIVEGNMVLNGVLINFIDTAGIRKTNDIVEQIGVNKSLELVKSADLIIVVLNNNEILTNEEKELIDSIEQNKRLIFVNKNDLETKLEIKQNYIFGNTTNVDGLNDLKKAIIEKFELDKIMDKDLSLISNVRQIDLIKKSLDDIESAIKNIKNNVAIDIVEIDIRNAWEHLGEIIGANYNEELLDNLFSNFCLGK